MNQTIEKKPNILLRLLAFLVTLALALGAIALVVNRDRLNLDALKRWYTYRSLEKSDSGLAEQFSYAGRPDDLLLDLDGDLMVCTASGVHIYSPGGVDYLNQTLLLESPGIAQGGGRAAVYDIGGRQLYLFDARSLAGALPLKEDARILSACLGGSGLLAVTTKEGGYKGVVTVYDADLKPLMSVGLSSQFLMDGTVTQSGSGLAVLAVGEAEGAFESTLLFYYLAGGEEAYAAASLGSNAILALDADSGGIWALGDSALFALSEAGSVTGRFDYDGRYLKNASLEGDGFGALILGRYRTGSTAELVTVDPEGKVLGSLSLSEQVLSLSASGKYVALLTADGLDIYTKDLTLYASLKDTRGARSVVLRSDASAFLVGVEMARLYLPD